MAAATARRAWCGFRSCVSLVGQRERGPLVGMSVRRLRYIFSINTGRSGSDYLHRIFAHVPGCRSFHQPAPIGNGIAMRRYAAGDVAPMREAAIAKVAAIREASEGAAVYCESNHCFIKGFGWFLPEFLPEAEIGVVHLTRDRDLVARSLLRIGCSPLTSLGREWVTTPEKQRPLIPPPALLAAPRLTYAAARRLREWFDARVESGRSTRCRSAPWRARLQDYELACLRWYVDETNALAESFRKRFPAVTYVKVDVEELNEPSTVHALLGAFGCEAAESIRACVGVPTNLMRPGSDDSDAAQEPPGRRGR